MTLKPLGPESAYRPTLGIFGGMGPAATGQFLIELTNATPAVRDQDHIQSIVLCDPSIPDRTQYLLQQSDEPLVPIRTGLETLIGWGADVLAVPCNTAHAYIDRFIDELPVPLVHIVEATLDDAQAASPEGAWLTATTGTMATGLYQRAAERRGYTLYRPTDEQQVEIMATVGDVKAGRIAESGARYRAVAEQLFAERDLPALTACTELPIAFDASGLDPALAVSSLRALARATVRKVIEMDEAMANASV